MGLLDGGKQKSWDQLKHLARYDPPLSKTMPCRAPESELTRLNRWKVRFICIMAFIMQGSTPWPSPSLPVSLLHGVVTDA